MPIVHIKKHENNFVQIDKRPLSDERLSWKAKGLWAYLMSKPPDWKVYVAELAKRSKDGEHAIRSAMKELIEFGYAERRAIREAGKISEWAFYVYEQPITKPDGDFQHVENLDVENLDVENLPLNKNEDNKNEDISSASADSLPECAFFSGLDARTVGSNGNGYKGQVSATAARPKLEYHQVAARLENAFAETRGCQVPRWPSDDTDKKVAAKIIRGIMKTWRNPLMQDIWEQRCEKDTDLAERGIREVTKKMMADKLTFSNPIQIVSTFDSWIIDNKSTVDAVTQTAAGVYV